MFVCFMFQVMVSDSKNKSVVLYIICMSVFLSLCVIAVFVVDFQLISVT